jgi:hypothetical protein
MVMEMFKFRALCAELDEIEQRLHACKFKAHHADMWKRGCRTYQELCAVYNRRKIPLVRDV